MGEVVEYATTTIPLETLPSLLQINGEIQGNGIVTPAAYTTEDGETILILPQYSTVVVTSNDPNSIPVQQIVNGSFSVQSENGQTVSIPQNASYFLSGEGPEQPQLAVIRSGGDSCKKQALGNLGSGNVIIVSPNEANAAQIEAVASQNFSIAATSNDDDIEQFLGGDDRYHCNQCPMTFTRPRQIKRHLDEHKKEKPFKCRSCAASFNVERNLILHEASHNLTPNSSCPICEKRFLRVAGLCSHLRIHQVDDMVACQICKSEFELQSELDDHINSVHGEIQPTFPSAYSCRHCSVAFTDLSQYRKHMAEHRVIEKCVKPLHPRKSRQKTTLPSACDTPGPSQGLEEPQSAAAVSEPLAAQVAEAKRCRGRTVVQPNFKCSECGKAFRSKMLLDRHTLIHTGERPFQCDQCEKSFNQKSALNLHKMCHSGEKPHHCQFCFASFTQRGNLRSHIKSCHRVPQDVSAPNIIRCRWCSCTFKRISTYNTHLTLRHPESSTAASQSPRESIPARKRQRIILPENPTSTVVQQKTVEAVVDNSVTFQITTTSPSANNIEQSQPQTRATSQLIYTYLPQEQSLTVENDIGSNDGGQLESAQVALSPQPGPSNTVAVEVIEESFENVAVVDPDTQSIQHHRVTRINGVLFHCCSYCSKRFRKSHDFVRHMRIHTLEKPFACNICGNRFTNKSTLNTHFRVHAGPSSKRFRCHVCRKMFASSSSLKVHLRVHTGMKPFACTICDKRFRTSNHRQEHLLNHQKNKRIIQQRVISQQQAQQMHSENVQGVNHYFVKQTGLESQEPGSSAEQAPAVDPARRYMCSHCPKAYKKSDHLHYHLNAAHGSGQRPFACQVCGKTFAMFAVLRNHIRTHAKNDLSGKTQKKGKKEASLEPFEGSLLHHANLRPRSANDIIEQVTETACFDFGSMSRNSILPASPNMPSRVEENMPNDYDGFAVDHLCFHCGRSFATEELARAHVALEHESGLTGQTPAPQQDRIDEGEQQHPVVIQSWMPGADVLPELSLSLLQPPSIPNGQPGIESDSLIGEEDNQESVNSIAQNLNNSRNLKEDGPGLLEQVAAQQEYPVAGVIMADNNMPLQQNSSPVPSNSHVATNDNNTRSRENAKGVLAIHHADTNSYEFRCTLCGAVFYTKQSISRHMTDMHSSKSTHTCLKCNRQLSSSKALLLHSTLCDKKDWSAKNSDNNTPALEEIPNSEVNDPTTQQHPASPAANVCRFCDRSFFKRTDLVRHERTHTGDRPFRCQQCGRSFRLKSALTGHQLTHLPKGERSTFSCHLCKAKLGSRAALAVHIRRHTGVQPYTCPHCPDLKFSTPGRRRSHIINTHIRALPKTDAA